MLAVTSHLAVRTTINTARPPPHPAKGGAPQTQEGITRISKSRDRPKTNWFVNSSGKQSPGTKTRVSRAGSSPGIDPNGWGVCYFSNSERLQGASCVTDTVVDAFEREVTQHAQE